MTSDPADLGLFEMAEAVRQGRLRSVDLVEACLERIARREAQVHAWAWLDPTAETGTVNALLRPPPDDLLEMVRIGDTVNKVAHDGPEVQEPFDPATVPAAPAPTPAPVPAAAPASTGRKIRTSL